MPYRQRTAQGVQDAGRTAAAVQSARLAGTAAAYRGGLSVLITAQLLLWTVQAGAAPGALWQAALGLLPVGLLIRYLCGRVWEQPDLRPPWELLLLLPPLLLDAALLLHTLLSLLHRLMPSYPAGILRTAVPLLLTGGVLLGREQGAAFGVCLWRRIPALLCVPVVWQAIAARGVDRLFPLMGDGFAATAGMAAGGMGALWGICLLSAAVPVGVDAAAGHAAAGRNAAANQTPATTNPAAAPTNQVATNPTPASPDSATPPPHRSTAKPPKPKAARIFGPAAAGRNTAANRNIAAAATSPRTAHSLQHPAASMRPLIPPRLSHTLLPLLLCCAYAFALSCAAPWTVTGDAPTGVRLLQLGRTGGSVLISGLGALLWLLCCMLGWCMLLGSAGQLVRRALPGKKLHRLAPLLAALASAAVVWLCPGELPGRVTGLLPLRILPLGAAAGIAGLRTAIRKARGSL